MFDVAWDFLLTSPTLAGTLMNDDVTDQTETVFRPLLKPPDAARAIGVCERTLWSLTAPRGPLPCIRIRRSVRYDPADLTRFVEESKARQKVLAV